MSRLHSVSKAGNRDQPEQDGQYQGDPPHAVDLQPEGRPESRPGRPAEQQVQPQDRLDEQVDPREQAGRRSTYAR